MSEPCAKTVPWIPALGLLIISVASLLLGSLFGGIGVALGTLLGSIVSIASHLWYSMPRTRSVIDFSRRQFLLSGVLSPLLWTFPLLAAAAVSLRNIAIHPLVGASATVLSLIGATRLLLRTQAASEHA